MDEPEHAKLARAIGRDLRERYADTLKEPPPAHLAGLVARLGEEQAVGSDDGEQQSRQKPLNRSHGHWKLTSSVAQLSENGDGSSGGRCSEGRKAEPMEEITLGASCGLHDDALRACIELRPNDVASRDQRAD
jgi:hypothetical protein